MSDFNAGLEAAAKWHREQAAAFDELAERCSHNEVGQNAEIQAGMHRQDADAILALRRPDAPDAVREAGEVERLRQALREIASLKIEDLYYGDNNDGIDNLAALYARQALRGER